MGWCLKRKLWFGVWDGAKVQPCGLNVQGLGFRDRIGARSSEPRDPRSRTIEALPRCQQCIPSTYPKNRTPCLGVLFATDIAIYGTVLSSFGFKNIGPSESPRTLEIQYRNPKPPKENPAAPLSHALSPVILKLRSNYFVKPVQGLGLRA